MNTCDKCGASNPDVAQFCLDCGVKLDTSSSEQQSNNSISPTDIPPTEIADGSIPKTIDVTTKAAAPKTKTGIPETVVAKANNSVVGQSLRPESFQALAQSVISKQRKADIMFVLDCTGSMQGEIDAVRDAITSFADSIETFGVRARVGLIEFRDRLIKEEHRVITFDGQPFTSNPKLFRQQIAHLRASGGGDEPESSLDAVLLALRQPFSSEANKVLVLITDAPPHIPDVETKNIQDVLQKIREVRVDQVYVVMRTEDPRSQIYLKLMQGTRGMAFNIGKGNDFRSRAEHFKQTLMGLGKTISSATR